MPIIDRLESLYNERLEDQEIMRQTPRSKDYDSSGSATTGEIDDHYFLGMAEYVLHQNVASFKRNLTQAAKLQIELFRRYDAGTLSGDGSYVTMNAQDQLFAALAAGAFPVAEEFAKRIGGRPEVEKHDTVIRKALGHTLKYFVLNDLGQVRGWLLEFQKACQFKKYRRFEGFVVTFQGMLDESLSEAADGLTTVAETHRSFARSPTIFAGTVDELLSIWGIGLANLARHRGLAVKAIPPYIPADLLVDVNQN